MNTASASITARVGLLAVFAALFGCDNRKGESEEDAVAACAAAESKAACEALEGPTYRCGWVKTVTVTSEAPCETVETSTCVPYAKGAFPPGCAPLRGCLDSQPGDEGRLIQPAYREDEPGVTLLVENCTGDPVGWTPCPSGAADADVPACACACELAP